MEEEEPGSWARLLQPGGVVGDSADGQERSAKSPRRGNSGSKGARDAKADSHREELRHILQLQAELEYEKESLRTQAMEVRQSMDKLRAREMEVADYEVETQSAVFDKACLAHLGRLMRRELQVAGFSRAEGAPLVEAIRTAAPALLGADLAAAVLSRDAVVPDPLLHHTDFKEVRRRRSRKGNSAGSDSEAALGVGGLPPTSEGAGGRSRSRSPGGKGGSAASGGNRTRSPLAGDSRPGAAAVGEDA